MKKYRIYISSDKVILRVVIEKKGKIENLFISKPFFEPEIGNIYKGKVDKFLQGLNSAFINIGEMKSGFLQLNKSEFYLSTEEDEEVRSEQILKEGKEVLVQICKPGEDEKSPKVTEKIVLPGRFFVLIPNLKIQKISKKIKDINERKRLIRIFKRTIGEKFGFIIRTAAINKKEFYIYREIEHLLNIWKRIKRDYRKKSAPSLLWKELPLYLKVLRDYVDENCEFVEVDDEEIFREVVKYANLFIPELKGKVNLYKDKIPMFIKYGFEEEFENFISKTVFLPSGGYLIIEKGKTLTAIDVNSGSMEMENFEQTAFKTNMEAANEIPRQIKCRNLSGLVIIDFIDIRKELEKKVFKKFIENLKEDKSKISVLFISQLGLIGITREKNDYSIYNLLLKECSYCEGYGINESLEIIYLKLRKKIFEIFSDKAYNEKLEIEISQSLYEFIFKNQLFKNFLFFDRIKFKVNNQLKKNEFKIF
ncbi:MAG: Rne/Rng family ribonuclease [Candidatus Omnitrophica bacterium]|nr:Rne/Rng family ribonuclease [Candidatus Omnitrophota bacterium]MCM8810825.1 Rne/Rng family ribonuclease [Candidatus Omnitrophota bacterium]MCM8833166.1 Rne/Rng family ribonuclease [Candidatus Omnitrophota bacterium]